MNLPLQLAVFSSVGINFFIEGNGWEGEAREARTWSFSQFVGDEDIHVGCEGLITRSLAHSVPTHDQRSGTEETRHSKAREHQSCASFRITLFCSPDWRHHQPSFAAISSRRTAAPSPARKVAFSRALFHWTSLSCLLHCLLLRCA